MSIGARIMAQNPLSLLPLQKDCLRCLHFLADFLFFFFFQVVSLVNTVNGVNDPLFI